MTGVYSDFAGVYGSLQSTVDYDGMCDYIAGQFKKHGVFPKLVLDLACGDGALAVNMLERGWDVIGADASSEMLIAASSRLGGAGKQCLLLCQSMQELDLYGTVNAAVCTLDSINHLPSAEDVKKAFSRLHLFVEPRGLFIFDVNTLYKHREVLGGNTFVYDTDDAFCVWQNAYNAEDSSVDISLDVFTPEKKGSYSRFTEEFTEYCYSPQMLERALGEAGFSVLEITDGYTQRTPSENSERLVITAERI